MSVDLAERRAKRSANGLAEHHAHRLALSDSSSLDRKSEACFATFGTLRTVSDSRRPRRTTSPCCCGGDVQAARLQTVEPRASAAQGRMPWSMVV